MLPEHLYLMIGCLEIKGIHEVALLHHLEKLHGALNLELSSCREVVDVTAQVDAQ